MTIKSSLAALLLALSVVAFAPGRAALAAGSKAAKKEQAEVHYDQGKAYYRAGAFDLAIQEFLEGYKLDPRVGVLFNIARGYEELKNRDKAIEFYEKYLDQGAAAAAATEARARLVVLERQAKDDDERRKAEAAESERKRKEVLTPPPVVVATPMPAPVETKPPAAESATPAESAVAPSTSGAAPEGTVTATAPAPATASDPARTLKVAGLVTGGIGVVLIGVGSYYALHASSIKSDVAAEKIYSPSKDSDYKTASALSVVGFVGGAVAIAGGAVLYYLGSNKEHEGSSAPTSTACLTPVVGPDGAALLLSGRF